MTRGGGGGKPLGLSTSCSRFPKKLPGISQNVAQKLLFEKKVAQKLLKKTKTFFGFSSFIWSDAKICNLYNSKYF